MKLVSLSYSDFWSKVSSKAMVPQYTDDGDSYTVFAIEGGVITWQTCILKGSDDATNFEASHKSACNLPLEVKSGAGRPQRVAPSPQPINTIQHWSGYKLTLSQGQTSNYIDISFPSMIYLKGGVITPDNNADGTCTLELDVLLGANDMTIVPKILDGVYVTPNQPINFLSPEAMAVDSTLKLRLYLKHATGPAQDRTIYVVAEYFK